MIIEDRIMFGVVIFGFVVWVGVYVYELWAEWKRKKILTQQIAAGVVPVEYSSMVREFATKQNNEAMGFPTSEQEVMFAALRTLREKVSLIRAQGFDAAREARDNKRSFAMAIADNPYPKGSGEARQWARGFCQDGGHPPKAWMDRA